MSSPLILAGSNTPLLISGVGSIKVSAAPTIQATVVGVGYISDTIVYIDVDTNITSGTLYCIFTTTPGSVTKANITSNTQIGGPGITRLIQDGRLASTEYTAVWYVVDNQGTESPAGASFNTHGTTVTTPSGVIAPTFINPTSVTISEGQVTGQIFASLSTDGTNCTFSEITDTSNVFTVNSSGGLSLSASVLESSSPYSVTVRATNGAGTFDQAINVNVTSASSSLTPDTTVSSAGGLSTVLASWSSDWAGTVPSGKTSSDERVIGITGSIAGYSASNYSFPRRVTVRSTGTVSVSGSFPYLHSAAGGNISGSITMNNCTNLRFYLCFGSRPGLGTGNTDCWYERCEFYGSATDANTPASQAGRIIESWTGGGFKDCRFMAFKTYSLAFQGVTDFTVSGNVFEQMSDDDLKGQGPTSTNFNCNRNWFATRHISGASAHSDFSQWQGGTWNNTIWWGNVGMVKENTKMVQGGLWNSNTNIQNNIVAEQNIYIMDGKNAMNAAAGSNRIARYNTVIRAEKFGTDAVQVQWIPQITGQWDTTDYNIVTAESSANNVNEGPNGIKLIIGSADNAIPDWSQYTPYWDGRPGFVDDFGAMMPKVGSRAHWGHSDPAGAFIRSEEIFSLGVHPGNVGAPVADSWTRQYNDLGGISSTHTGTYDSDGNNV